MADDWEKLGEDWKDHPVGMIGEIDCTTDEGLALCEDFEVQVSKEGYRSHYTLFTLQGHLGILLLGPTRG